MVRGVLKDFQQNESAREGGPIATLRLERDLRSSQRQRRRERRARKKIGIQRICLDSGLQGQKGIARI